MKKQVYAVGDESRLVVKNFLQELKNIGCEFKSLYPDSSEIKKLPDEPVHLIVCLEAGIDFSIVRDISYKQQQTGLFIYMIGSMGTISVDEDKYLKSLSSFRFPSYNIEMEKLTSLMEKNDVAKRRILVVDDEPILLRSIKTWLGDEFEVFLVNSGELAMEFLDMHPVDLVLLDYKMPTMDGPEVLKQIRNDKNLQELPVIFLTANNDKESIMNVMNLKPNGYILKTMMPDEIKKSIQNFFKNRIMVFS